MNPYVDPRHISLRRGVADIYVHPGPGQEGHHIGYLKGYGWFCGTCHNTTCGWIRAARESRDVPDMEGI